MKHSLLTLTIALSLSTNAYTATLELKNKATWDAIITGATDYARFGNAMAVGDFNADGKADLAVGSREEDSPRGILNTGAVSIFFGGSTFQTLKNLSASNSAGHSLSNANATMFGAVNEYLGDILAVGDFDGDKVTDLIIAAQKNANYTANKIYILYGGSNFTTNMSTSSAQTILKPTSMHVSGIATGDLSGDGVDDIAVVDNYNNKVYIVYGNKTRRTGTIDLTNASDSIISRVSIDAETMATVGIGDLNGDGKKDLAIGVPNEGDAATGLTGNGKIFLRKGTGSALPKAIDLDSGMDVTIIGGHKSEQLGNSFYDGNYLNSLIFSDVNGDGIDDLITGSSVAWREGLSSSTGTGKVQVYFGRTTLPKTIDLFDQYNLKMTVNEIDKTYLGASVKAADLNKDGINDIIMSAPNAGNSSHTSGWVFVVYGKRNVSQTSINLVSSADLTIQAPDPIHALAGASYGQTLAIGDFDADGKPDLAGGALTGSYLGGIAKGYVLMISDVVGKTANSITNPTVPSASLAQINGRLVVTVPSAKVVNYLGNLVVSFNLFVDLPNITLDNSSLVMSGVSESSNPAIVDLGTTPFELRIPLLTFGNEKYMVNLKSNDLYTFSISTLEPR
jgi:hypothetical protein